jgi:Zn-dependent metalloprotease
VPNARLEAVAIAAEFIGERERLGADQSWQAQAMLFSDVLANTMVYLTENLRRGDNLRVVNVSLAYNFVARGILGDADPDSVTGLKLHIAEQASVIRTMARLVENEVLFVVAAGNDSADRDQPLSTRFASPFAWAGTYAWTSGEPVRNIIVVEAFDRDGKRANFSNVGGHIAAPGVDIMSTLGGTTAPFAVCSGTSQAAPHITALAAILFELDPKRTPADVIALITNSAAPPHEGTKGAPRVNALATTLAATKDAGTLLADLDSNGMVDQEDVNQFARQLAAIEASAATEAPFTDDLNGDGVVDDNECFYPLIDLNGDGEASLREAKSAPSPLLRSDLRVIESAWSGSGETLRTAMAQSGLSGRIAHTLVAAANVATQAPPKQCRRRDPALLVAGLPPLEPPAPAPTPPANPDRSDTSEPDRSVVAGGVTGSAAGDASSTTQLDAELRAEVAQGVEALKKDNPDIKITINPATGLPSSISGFKPDPSAIAAGARALGEPTEEDTRRIVESFLSTGGLTAALPTRNRQAELRYVGRRKDPDVPGRFVANVEQRVGNVKVFGSSAKLTVENSLGVTRFQGTLSAVALSDTNPSVAEPDAITAARRKLGELMRGSANAPAPPLQMGPNPDTAPASAELIVFDPALLRAKVKGGTRLAWMVAIDSYRIFVDAKTGEVFHFYRDKPTTLIRRVYDLTQSSSKPIVDEDGRTSPTNVPTDAEQAFRYSAIVRDYFFLNFGRNSFDDNDEDGPKGGAPLESFVRYGNVRNAFWCPFKSYDCPKPNVMVFGPGYAGAIDIVAHEMVHGIIQHEANLIYSDEPGAVNEGLADIFAVLIEFYARSGRGNWLIGEDAPGFSRERPLRDLAHPNLTNEAGTVTFDPNQRFSSVNRGQPSHYGEVVRPTDPICASTWLNDNGCVHFNSGILNKFAHLIAEGGEHRGTQVKGIGLAKLGRLTYRTLTTQLNQTSDLMETAEGFLQSCLDLASRKVGGFTESDCDSVMGAQQAVGLVFGS